MKCLHLRLALCIGMLGTAFSMVGAENEKPKEYPDMPLAEGAKPRYAALAVDAWNSKVAYILFDGNVKDGYRKMYVWIPGDPKYGSPLAMTSTDSNNFGPFTILSSHDRQNSSVSWKLTSDKRTWTSGGTRTSVDYVTGKEVTSSTPVETHADSVFTFQVDYALGSSTSTAKKFPLDISISDGLSTSESWEKVPPPLTPWETRSFSMSATPVPGDGDKEGQLHFKGQFNCTVRSLPEDAEVTLVVRPYMEPPIYSNTVSAAEAFGNGVSVSVPYGWYNFFWIFQCNGLKASSQGQHSLYPLSK